jgi:hypothetical protein
MSSAKSSPVRNVPKKVKRKALWTFFPQDGAAGPVGSPGLGSASSFGLGSASSFTVVSSNRWVAH